MNLVEVKGSEVYCDSRMVAKKFGVKHADVIRKLESLISNGEMIGKVISEKAEYRGNEYYRYYLTAQQTVRLLMQYSKGSVKRYISEIFPDSISKVNKLLEAIENMDIDRDIVNRFVYMAQDGNGNIKIGLSKDPKRRIKELNCGNADKLTLVFIKATSGDKYTDETYLHTKYANERIRGEWFSGEKIKEILG